MAVTPTVRISIDVIAVSGLLPRQVPVFAASLEQSLTDLFRRDGIPPALAGSANDPSRAIGPVTIGQGRPGDAGRAVARAIYEGMAR